MYKIFIGDSWGVGEWSSNPKTHLGYISGPGVGQYFSLTTRVINLCSGGASNSNSINRLDDLLKQFTPTSYDTFYWIVTDPFRCVKNQDYTINGNILDFTRNLLEQSLSKINSIAASHNITINLIGGLCDLHEVDISSYSCLKIIVPSWGELISNNYPASLIGDMSDLEVNNIKNINKQEYIRLTDLSLKKFNYIANEPGFIACHPNMKSQRILRDFLDPSSAEFY